MERDHLFATAIAPPHLVAVGGLWLGTQMHRPNGRHTLTVLRVPLAGPRPKERRRGRHSTANDGGIAETGDMRIVPEINGTSIVLVGSFNPAIFTPAWFELHRLLPQGTAEIATLEIAHGQATVFKADWLHLNVVPDRFSVETTQAPDVRIRDLVVRTFREHLNHTPLNALGINRNVHFNVRSLEDRDRIGQTLAPIEPWGEWAEELGLGGKNGGMTSLTMTQVDPEGRPKGGRINVKVEPSARVGEGRTGVYVNVNDHYPLDADQPGPAEAVMEMLEKHFDASVQRSNRLIDHVMSL